LEKLIQRIWFICKKRATPLAKRIKLLMTLKKTLNSNNKRYKKLILKKISTKG
jgi:hypothetical protein